MKSKLIFERFCFLKMQIMKQKFMLFKAFLQMSENVKD